MENQIKFRRLGTMLNCSSNGALNITSLKKWIDIQTDLGYNTFLLYMEDTYELDDNPYFGYMRGRYSQDELKELDSYALSKGVELIPCIQTLAHLNALTRWPAYKPLWDTGCILLAGEEKVYALIDQMFATMSKCFSTRTLNVGMDEASMIGRGKYYDLHGDVDHSQIFIDHLKRVAEIGAKYGYSLTIWSDMFFRLVTGGKYGTTCATAHIREGIAEQIPENVELVFWHYAYSTEEQFDQVFAAHNRLKENTWFAGGIRTWQGFSPENLLSIEIARGAVAACIRNGIQDVFFTLWGGDGGECSKFAALPALFYISELAKGNTDDSDIKAKFKDKYGISFDCFTQLDMPGTPGKHIHSSHNPEKYLLYNDCFTGLFDSTISGGENESYAEHARRLEPLKKDKEWGYLFATQHALCDVLSIKAELGVKTREAYASRDKEKLEALITDYKKLSEKLEVFHQVFMNQWFAENKPHGSDVQDIHLGGLMTRVKSCTNRLQALLDGQIDRIEELEEKQLDITGAGTEFTKEPASCNKWNLIVTTNLI